VTFPLDLKEFLALLHLPDTFRASQECSHIGDTAVQAVQRHASDAVLSASVIALTSTLGLMSTGKGLRSYAGERRQPFSAS
jgi:hypothetical protein